MCGNAGTEDVTLYVRWNDRRKECFTAIGWQVKATDVRSYMYRRGIKTEFRMIKDPRIRTTTVNEVIRYLFIMISAIICAIYAALRLGEVTTFTEGYIIMGNEDAATLYRVRRTIRQLLVGSEKVVLQIFRKYYILEKNYNIQTKTCNPKTRP